MAICTVRSPFESVAGAVGGSNGVVTYVSGGRQMLRDYVVPTNPQTSYQTAIRGYLALASQAYQQTTDAEREAWATLAANMTRDDALGQGYDISAQMAYMMVNQYRQIAGEAITDTAPAYELAILSGTPSASHDASTSNFYSTEDADLQTFDGFALISATDALPGLARQARANEYAAVGIDYSDSIATVTSGALLVLERPDSTVRHILAVGERVGVMITPLSSGYVPGTKVAATVTVTLES